MDTPAPFPAKELFALIALISDPVAAQARLAEIFAAKADLEALQRTVSDQLEIAEKVSAESAERKIEADNASKVSIALAKKASDDLRNLNDRTEAAGRAIAKGREDLESAREMLDGEASELSKREEAFKASVAATEQAMKAREEAVAAREANVKTEAAAVANAKAVHDKRVAELRKIAVG